jgi:hypothetical protein
MLYQIAAMMLAAVAPEAFQGLTLSLRVHSPILVGEPTKAEVTFTASNPLADVGKSSLIVLIDDGAGYRQFGEAIEGTAFVVEVAGPTLQPGAPRVYTAVLGVSGGLYDQEKHFQFAFPRAGRYRVIAQWRGVKSNEAIVMATTPQGRDAELFSKYLQNRAELLATWGIHHPTERRLVERLISEYPDSPYLRRAQVLDWRHKVAQVAGLRGRPMTEPLSALLQEIEGATWPSGEPFNEDRLLLVARTRAENGDHAGSTRVYRDIESMYPNSEASQEAQEQLKEQY